MLPATALLVCEENSSHTWQEKCAVTVKRQKLSLSLFIPCPLEIVFYSSPCYTFVNGISFLSKFKCVSLLYGNSILNRFNYIP